MNHRCGAKKKKKKKENQLFLSDFDDSVLFFSVTQL